MRQNAHILVAAPREVHHQYVMGGHRGSNAQGLGNGVRALESRQNASVRESLTTASSAAVSSCETYSARPESCSAACSGPMEA